jgi:hypothetical protein
MSDAALEIVVVISGLVGAAILVGYFLGIWK